MNRILTYLNLCGVLCLAVLCGFQWQANSIADAEIDRMDKAVCEQKAKIEEQEKSLTANAAKLDAARGELSTARKALEISDDKLRFQARNIEQLTTQRDQVIANLDQWKNAIAARDAAIKQAGEEIQKISADCRDLQHRLNDVTVKYNEIARK